MLIALIADHIQNGFFIFRPGEGYEYVANMLSHANLGISWTGAAACGYLIAPDSHTLHTAPMFHLADLASWGLPCWSAAST
jgi:hypothetical protein